MRDYTVLIGRFQPLHNGHSALIKRALGRSKNLIILVGSANSPSTPRNPFSAIERTEFIRAEFPVWDYPNVHIRPIEDMLYNDGAWIEQVEKTVNNVIYTQSDDPDKVSIALTGFEKDSTSYYLRFFPDWKSDFSDIIETYNGTEIREWFYDLEMKRPAYRKGTMVAIDGAWDLGLPEDSPLLTQPLIYQQRLYSLAKAWDFNKRYDPSQYPIIVVTVDAVVTANNHLLLIKRKNDPGKGLWALPGGHIEPTETLEQAMLRELREETSIDRTNRVLKANIRTSKTFDHPQRSERGRVITTAFHIRLPDEEELPNIKAGDDAADAKWVPIADLTKSNIFEDHYDIATYFLRSL